MCLFCTAHPYFTGAYYFGELPWIKHAEFVDFAPFLELCKTLRKMILGCTISKQST